MSGNNYNAKLAERAESNFEQIKESLKGIYEIFKISFDENDLFFRAGLENIIGLYKNFVELLLNDLGTKSLSNKLLSSELKLDIALDDCIKK